MIESLLGPRDQFTLTNIALYLTQNSLEPFVFFANHVPLKSQLSLTEETAFKSIGEPIGKAFTQFGVKIIPPLKALALRMIQSYLGFTTIHLYFIKICKALLMPNEALPIIDYPGLFKSMDRGEEVDFLATACEVYIDVGRYGEAYGLIRKAAARLDEKREELALGVFKKLIVLSIFAGKPLGEFSQPLHKFCSKMEARFNSNNLLADTLAKKQRLRPMDYNKFTFFLDLKEWRPLAAAEAAILEHENLMEVYEAARFAGLGRYIESELKGLNWRIKSESVKGVGVGEWDVVRGVNQGKEVYKYDCQQNTMYFNHQACDQNQLNSLISKAFLMQNEVAHCKVERKEEISRAGFSFGGGLFGGGMFGSGGRKGRSMEYSDEDDE